MLRHSLSTNTLSIQRLLALHCSEHYEGIEREAVVAGRERAWHAGQRLGERRYAKAHRALTGERPEPAFVITKPYSEEQVISAISQAMFFSSTETLHA